MSVFVRVGQYRYDIHFWQGLKVSSWKLLTYVQVYWPDYKLSDLVRRYYDELQNYWH